MHKWNIDIVLKGSGVILPCTYSGRESVAHDVVEKLFTHRKDNDIIGLSGNNGNSSTFVLAGEIASIDIYE